MLSFTPRLDAYDAMQKRDLGTNTGLYRNFGLEGVTRDYKRQQSDYGFARRILKDAARRGDTQAAVGLIGLSDKARAEGVDFGGVQRYDTNQANAQGRLASNQQAVSDLELGRKANRTFLQQVIDGPVNPNATAGAGRGTALGLPEQPMQRPDERSDLGRRAFEQAAIMGGDNTEFRQGLDRAIGMAKTPQEMNDLRDVAEGSGISTDAFNRRKNWWQNRR